MILNRITDQEDRLWPFLIFLARKRQHHFPTKSASLPRAILRASLPGMFFPASLLQRFIASLASRRDLCRPCDLGRSCPALRL